MSMTGVEDFPPEKIADAIHQLRERGAFGPMVIFEDDLKRVLIMELRRYLEESGVVKTKQHTGPARLAEVDALLDRHGIDGKSSEFCTFRAELWKALGRAENNGFDECLGFFISFGLSEGQP